MTTPAESTYAPEASRNPRIAGEGDAPQLLMLIFQFLLVLLTVRLLRIEEQRGLFDVLGLATAGFVVHRRLPARWRPACFLAVSLASFPLVLGWRESAWVIGVGVALIGVCHLPVPFLVRVLLLITAAAGLFAWRSESVAAFWPVLGSMFMFRLWIYIRELRRATRPVPWSQRLSYFFLLPNACFPFFPIVDYRRFCDSYVPHDAGPVAQQGIAWILRGLIHLLLYRAIKTFLLPGPQDLIDAEYLALFLVTNYALYLRISGHFHIITGILHLFGYDLPRTHDRYFLASSLSDIWRRINIYWKNFLSDHVFFPTYFALRRLPRSAAVAAGVLVTFLATWILHSWQAFWLIGHFPVKLNDAVLWLSAGVLVAGNSLWQYRAAMGQAGRPSETTFGVAVRRSLQVAATFLTVSFFWACWTLPGFPALVRSIAGAGGFDAEYLIRPVGILLAAVAAGTAAQLITARLKRDGIATAFPLERSSFACVAVLGLLSLGALPDLHRQFGPDASRRLAAMTVEAPTASELGLEVAGYYEELAEANLQASPFVGPPATSSPQQVMWSEVTRERNDAIETEMIPGWKGTLGGAPFEVNRWGMRDDDVSRRKRYGVSRIAIVGSSATMGFGVHADADFESLVERRINETLKPAAPRVELLNFATGGYVALQWAAALREKVLPFRPDAVYYVAHQGELFGPPRHLAKCIELELSVPYPCLNEIVDRAGIRAETSWYETELLLQPHARAILACIYRGIVDDCRQRGIVPVYVYCPMPGIEQVPPEMDAQLIAIADKAGFAIIDLSDWAAGRSSSDLMMDGHHHPTAEAHRIIADKLYEALRSRTELLPLPSTSPESRTAP